jgi:predicted RNA-binding protein with PUA-like domain
MPESNKRERRYWLFKSEPECYSIDDLKRDKRTFWAGVRNYQARNLLRDEVQVGDGVFFYHSSTDPMAIVGTMEVVRAGYPDHTAFDPKDDHFDPKSKKDEPTWFMVDVAFKEKFTKPVTRDVLKAQKDLSKMVLLQQGSRLSIQPVTAEQWGIVRQLAES